MTKILYAAPVVESLLDSLKNETSKLAEAGITPTLKVILVGNDPSSLIYTRNKKKFCEKFGASCEIIQLDEKTSQENFVNIVAKYTSDKDVHGVLIQLPLPSHLSDVDVYSLIPPEKDVDGFHPDNISKIYFGSEVEKQLAPCTPKGILTLLKFYNIELEGKKVVVIGRSYIVGKPMSLMLMSKNATVTLCHSKTKNLKEHTKQADIIISAVGSPKFISSDHIGENSPVVIDVGIKKVGNSISGDCHFENIKDNCSAISPVPGGVGPLTILSLGLNLILATQNQRRK